MSRSVCIRLGGIDLIPDLSGALYAPDFRTLLVADLHLEKSTSLARRGVHLPPYDTRQSLQQLSAVLAASAAQRLIFLGDSFHDGEARMRLDPEDLQLLQAITTRADTLWIAGNHDPAPPADIGGRVVNESVLGSISLRHQPRVLAEGEHEIAGHLHPAATVEVRGTRLRRRCFIADARRLIMPAFGSYTGSLNVRAKAFEGLFGDFDVWMIGTKAIHRFPDAKVSRG
ncbi:ligase-associated DNA damage response endonuclease PdeM [Aestuariivirga sp.]|uniref:ligase-associated DNA damage response endonuclease PdeM n=1 Tax=Aestuariivirga sp. TaxID=2650926 RepID=UPI003783B791